MKVVQRVELAVPEQRFAMCSVHQGVIEPNAVFEGASMRTAKGCAVGGIAVISYMSADQPWSHRWCGQRKARKWTSSGVLDAEDARKISTLPSVDHHFRMACVKILFSNVFRM